MLLDHNNIDTHTCVSNQQNEKGPCFCLVINFNEIYKQSQKEEATTFVTPERKLFVHCINQNKMHKMTELQKRKLLFCTRSSDEGLSPGDSCTVCVAWLAALIGHLGGHQVVIGLGLLMEIIGLNH